MGNVVQQQNTEEPMMFLVRSVHRWVVSHYLANQTNQGEVELVWKR